MFSIDSQSSISHRLDLRLVSESWLNEPIDLAVEELPESLHFASDCASSVGSVSTTGGCVGGCASSASTVGSMGSIVSSGGGGGGGGGGNDG
ncbi:hypothetical protein [Burkholderia sp. 22PA0106]|uniref:hypothetical protein n=1 Tax=Burkholderia sp. 22PA0106 TaxID=3237371 RepID=UPI0039C2B75D